MKVLLVSTYDNANGSGKAAYRLHQGLQQIGIDSHMLVQGKSTGDKAVMAPRSKLAQGWAIARESIDALPLKWHRQRERTVYSLQCFPDQISAAIAPINPDIINLHWTNAGFVQIETIAKLKAPIVWTLHDMWAFTGGCHYDQDCHRYTMACGACPQLHSTTDRDLSRWVWHRKSRAWKQAPLTIVTPSRWLADCAIASSLFQDRRVEVIPNGIDPQIYKPIPQQIARDLLNLPGDKQLICFGALQATDDPRKGFHLLKAALVKLKEAGWSDQLELVIFGTSQTEGLSDLGFKVHSLGRLSDDLSLTLIYSATDLFVAPSTQENLANTVLEALACGTPCVAFKIGGMPDLIEHDQNGYLAQALDAEDLARGIQSLLEDPERYLMLCDRARQKVLQEFTLAIQAQRYQSLFTELQQDSSKLGLSREAPP
jgi:glycosyltransferase involved in cell wall biosynthesis